MHAVLGFVQSCDYLRALGIQRSTFANSYLCYATIGKQVVRERARGGKGIGKVFFYLWEGSRGMELEVGRKRGWVGEKSGKRLRIRGC